MESFPCAAFALANRIQIFPPLHGWTWKMRIENHYNFWVPLEGSGQLRVNGTDYPLLPGTAFLFAPGDQVDAGHTAHKPISNLAIHLHPLTNGQPDLRFPGLSFHGVQMRNLPLLRELAAYGVTLGHAPSQLSHEEMHSVARTLFLMAWRDRQRPALDAIGEHIQSQIDHILREPRPAADIESLARDCGLSRAQYTRRFRQLTQRTPAQFIIEARLQVATQLLGHSRMSVEAVADALGYSDLFFFSRQFKQRLGVSPLAYRKRGGPLAA